LFTPPVKAILPNILARLKMRNLVLSLLVFITLGVTGVLAQQALVYGTAADYAGTELVFYTYSDYITLTEVEIGRCRVKANGNFEGSVKVLETTYVFSHLGIYRIYFFAEPGKRYQLVLPAREEKTEAQRLSPFFRETDLQVGVANISQSDINFLVNAFDIRFNAHFDQIVADTYRGKSQNVDSLINVMEEKFKNEPNSYFKAYREYRYGLLRQVTLSRKSSGISNELFLNKPILYSNPSYMELFNLVYDKYFMFFSRTSTGNAIFSTISQEKSLTQLKKLLATNTVLSNDTLMELVILKSLYDEFFSSNFSRSALLTLLDSVYRTTQIPEHAIIAENIRSRITKLLPGFVPSPFKLKDVNGHEVTLDQLEGKYVYLNFCTTTSYTCLQDFSLLEKIYRKYRKKLEIVTISADMEKKDLESFLKTTGYSWTFLHFGEKPDVIKDFDVRAYPTYFLIGPDRKIILSPAPSPREGFEQRFFELLRSRGEI